MTRHIIASLAVAWLMVSAQIGYGLNTVTIVDILDDINSIWLDPGDSFTVIIQIATDESLTAGGLYVKDMSPGNPVWGKLTIDSVSWNLAKWNPIIEPTTPYALDAGNAYQAELGAVATDLVNGTGTGTFTYATLDLTLDAGAQYYPITLQVTDLIFSDTNFDQIAIGAGTGYTINITGGTFVTPAPGSVILGALGLNLVGWLKRRRRVAA